MKVIDGEYTCSREIQDDIALLDAGLGGGSAGHHFQNLHGAVCRTAQAARETLVQHDGLTREAKARAADTPVAHQAHGDVGGGVDPYRETEPLGAADHGCV